MDKRIVKIVITGGPCAGKTTGMSRVVEHFTKLGWKVLVVSEAATEYMTGNAKPYEIRDVNYQLSIYNLIKAKEKSYEEFADKSDFSKILILCDRGTLDGKAYLFSDESKKEWHDKLGLSETDMMREYDGVFHLITAAKGAEEYYTKSNNKARTETVEEAREADDRTLQAWTGHPHLKIIDNSTDFDTKILRLIKAIAAMLGEPEPFEIEKKFLVKMPDLKLLEKLSNVQKVEILQTYLNSKDGEETRVRQRGDGSSFIFTKTTKRSITGLKRVEVEKQIDATEYVAELLNTDTSLHQIRKTRYCISYNNSYLELDIYPFWDKMAILEVELSDEEETYELPDWIYIIADVTENEKFKNHSLAENYGLAEREINSLE